MWNVHGLLGSNGSSCLSMLVAGVGTVLGRRPPDAFDDKKALFLSPKPKAVPKRHPSHLRHISLS